MSYSSSQKELEKSLRGIGRASGATVGQINALVPAAADAAGVSVQSARQMAGTFASTGLIGTDMYSGLIKQSREYALYVGIDVSEATQTLADSFANPAKGALDLNKKLGFLNASMLESIEEMQASGDRLGAQKVLMQGVATATENATSKLGFFARGWAEFSKNSSNEFNAVGGFISRGFGLNDVEARLKTLQGQLSFRQSRMGTAGGLFDSLLGFDIDTIKADIAKAQAEVDKSTAANKKAGLDQRSLDINAIAKTLNPTNEAMEDLTRKAENFRKYLKDEGGADPLGNYTRAMNGLNAQAKQFASDIAAGGSQFADAIRSAQFGLKTVGFSPTAQSAAQIDENAANERLRALRSASTDTNLDMFNKQMQSIETARTLQLQTLGKQTTFDQNALGGAFSRMSGILQQQIIAAATNPKYGQTSPALIAAIAGHESTGNANVGYSRSLGEDDRPSSAYGLGQITRGTAQEASRLGYLPPDYDRTNTATMAQGIAAVLQMKIDQNGGNVERGIMAYRGSNDPNTNRAYLADVKRRAGEMGDLSEGGLAKDLDANARAAKAAAAEAANLTKNYGLNGFEADKTARVNAALAEAAASGRDKIEGYTDSVTKSAIAAATAARDLTNTRAGKDLAFDREQLGRTVGDQQAYSRARSIYGDTGSAMSQAYIEQARLNDNLRETKSLATDAFSSMLTDLRQGTSLAKSLENITGRLADKLLSKAADSVMSNLFAGLGNSGASGGGLGGILASLFGGGGGGNGLGSIDGAPVQGPPAPAGYANGGFTGFGGRNEVAGPVHKGEYVFDAAATARIGVASLEAMRTNRRGWADGGYVGNAPTWMAPPANGPQQAPANITVYNNSGAQVEAKEVEDGRGGRRQEIVINEAVAKGIGSSAGQQALGQRRVARR